MTVQSDAHIARAGMRPAASECGQVQTAHLALIAALHISPQDLDGNLLTLVQPQPHAAVRALAQNLGEQRHRIVRIHDDVAAQ
jgi:hypothetical protein